MHANARKVGWVIAGLLLLAGVIWLLSGARSRFEPPQRDGPPVLVTDPVAGPALWLATRQEEQLEYTVGASRRGAAGRWVREVRQHLRVQAHDPANAQRRWVKELKVVVEQAGDGRIVNAGPLRLLGQQDDVVWLWVDDELRAVSARDAAPLADRARLEQANPALAGLFPAELDRYAWFGGMVVQLADGRRVRLTLPEFRAEPYEVAAHERQAFDWAANLSHINWNGLHATDDFGVRHRNPEGQWIGLLSENEARDAEKDDHGDHYAGSEWITNEGDDARRGFWRAQLGQTREFSDGVSPRLARLEPVPGSGTYLQGRMLKGPVAPGAPAWQWRGASARPAHVEPLRLADPEGVLVLHRTRLDAQGRLALARIGPDYRELWNAVLPHDRLGHRWSVAGQRLLLFGNHSPGPGQLDEVLLSLDLRNGHWSGWSVGGDAVLPPASTP